MHNGVMEAVQGKVISIDEEGSLPLSGFLPVLEKNRIHIWSARYSDLERHCTVLSKVISPEEQKTASRFRKSDHAQKYILRHGVLRSILGQYTSQNQEMVVLKTGKNGKPALDPQGAYADVSFNLSHTSDRVLIVVTHKRRVGVDIVKMDPSYRFHASADYLLTPAEKAFLQSLEPALRYQGFFRIWAAKEAMLKVTGSTLTMMKKMDTAKIIHNLMVSPDYSRHSLNTPPPFFIWQFAGGSGHLGAIAVDSGNPS